MLFKEQLTSIPKRKMQRKLELIFMISLMLGFLGLSSGMSYRITSATYIEGHISGDIIWKLAHSPYIVTNDIIIDTGSTLTIEPGVEVRFDGNFTFRADGELFATGNESNPIVFTSNQPKPTAGCWNTIEFAGEANGSLVMNCTVVEYVRRGLTIRSTGRATIEKSEFMNVSEIGVYVIGESNIIIKESTVQSDENGIFASGNVSSGMIVVGNQIVSRSADGVLLHTSDLECHIQNVTISSNTISSGGDGIRFHNRGMYGNIFDVSISDNLVYAGGNGIYLYTYSWYDSVVSDVTVSGNVVSLNGQGSGISINSDSAWSKYLSDSSVSSNRVSNATDGIFVCAGEHTDLVKFDATIVGNHVTDSERGICIQGVHSQGLAGIETNITANCVCYNGLGVSFATHSHSLAQYNHIYRNLEGMAISSGATVNATCNYWGDETGPYHETLNPMGKGNSVKGNGTDLVFRPFLLTPINSLNAPPLAVLQADKEIVYATQPVKFNATASRDDIRIDRYFFAFGDGTNSSWTSMSTIEHNYTRQGIYNASLLVMDDLGIVSNNTAIRTIEVLTEKRLFDYALISVFAVATAIIVAVFIWKRAYQPRANERKRAHL